MHPSSSTGDRLSVWSLGSWNATQPNSGSGKSRLKLHRKIVETLKRWTGNRQSEFDPRSSQSSVTEDSVTTLLDPCESLISSVLHDRKCLADLVGRDSTRCGADTPSAMDLKPDEQLRGVAQRYIAALEIAELENRRVVTSSVFRPLPKPPRNTKHVCREHSFSDPQRRMRVVPVLASVQFPRSSGPPSADVDSRLGFGNLPDQIHRKAMKKGFNFTIMIVGESGLGKSTLVNSLLMQDFYKDREFVPASKRITSTTQIEKRQIDLGERGVKLRLTVVDTPGFSDAINCSESWKPIEEYIDGTFERYLLDEADINRQNIQDNRVHCCLYFVSPFGRGLRPVDVAFMRRLHHKVNIVPVIAKADALTASELRAFKERLLSDLDRYEIEIYRLPECDSDEEEEIVQLDKEIKSVLPFAVVGSNSMVDLGGGRRARGRQYPWGIVEVENHQHCDFTKLRVFLLKTHMQDLKDMALNVHYERFRAEYIKGRMNLRQADHHDAAAKRADREEGVAFNGTVNASVLLRQKEEELQRMQQIVNKMQEQMKRGLTANIHPPSPTTSVPVSTRTSIVASTQGQ